MPPFFPQSVRFWRLVLIHLFVAVVFFAPVVLFADVVTPSPSGLVPCGSPGGSECKFSDLYTLAQKIIDFLLFALAVPLATVAITWAGIKIVVGAQDPGKRKEAKEILKNAMLGLAIALASYLIIRTIIQSLVSEENPLYKIFK